MIGKTQLFRKVALERLASPEQLDTLLTVTTPRSWMALVAVIGLILVAGAWGVAGNIRTKASGTGVILRAGGIFNVVSRSNGQLLEVLVDNGATVAADQVIARLAQPELEESLAMAGSRLDEAVSARARAQELRVDSIRLQRQTLARHREALQAQIHDLEQQAQTIREQLPVDQELLAKGLITLQQVTLTKERLSSVEVGISGVQTQLVQLEADLFQVDNAGLEPDLQAEARIAELRRQQQELQYQLELSASVLAPHGGIVIEVARKAGDVVTAGQAILSLQPEEIDLLAVVYVPASKAKSIAVGMDVQISPTTLRREEFGFIRGTVTSVADFPATQQALLRLLENPPLVSALLQSGTVHEVRVELHRSATNQDAFDWSSGRGDDLTVSSGTLCDVEVVTRSQRPISLVIPYLKRITGLS